MSTKNLPSSYYYGHTDNKMNPAKLKRPKDSDFRSGPSGSLAYIDKLEEYVDHLESELKSNPLEWVSDEEIDTVADELRIRLKPRDPLIYSYGIIEGAKWMRQRMAEEFKKLMK